MFQKCIRYHKYIFSEATIVLFILAHCWATSQQVEMCNTHVLWAYFSLVKIKLSLDV